MWHCLSVEDSSRDLSGRFWASRWKQQWPGTCSVVLLGGVRVGHWEWAHYRLCLSCVFGSYRMFVLSCHYFSIRLYQDQVIPSPKAVLAVWSLTSSISNGNLFPANMRIPRQAPWIRPLGVGLSTLELENPGIRRMGSFQLRHLCFEAHFIRK